MPRARNPMPLPFVSSFPFAIRDMRNRSLTRCGAPAILCRCRTKFCPSSASTSAPSTTVINAYLAPVMSGYLAGTQSRVRTAWYSGPRPQNGVYAPVRVHVMQSNGGIISAEKAAREPVTTILSGPGGRCDWRCVCRANSRESRKSITFDMGGTSTDVALLSGELRTTSESMAAGLPVAVPMLEIHTVGAGGGSIARFDRGGALRVGTGERGRGAGADLLWARRARRR